MKYLTPKEIRSTPMWPKIQNIIDSSRDFIKRQFPNEETKVEVIDEPLAIQMWVDGVRSTRFAMKDDGDSIELQITNGQTTIN